jgi:hypothetical protein
MVKWMFKVKWDEHRAVSKHKVCLMVKGAPAYASAPASSGRFQPPPPPPVDLLLLPSSLLDPVLLPIVGEVIVVNPVGACCPELVTGGVVAVTPDHLHQPPCRRPHRAPPWVIAINLCARRQPWLL